MPINNLKKADDSLEIQGIQNFSTISGEGNFCIYGEINDTIGSTILLPLYEEIIKRQNQKIIQPINVFINSPGGSLDIAFDIVALFELAKKLSVPVHTYVLSFVASAASIIAVAGHKRFITKRSYHMLHYAQITSFANNPEMAERSFQNHKFVQSLLLDIYESNINTKALIKAHKKKTFDDLIKTDNLNIYSDDLIRYKFADEVL